MVSSKKRGAGQRIKKIISLLKIKKKSLSVITDGISQLVKDLMNQIKMILFLSPETG